MGFSHEVGKRLRGPGIAALSALVPLLLPVGAGSAERHQGGGLVLDVDRAGKKLTVSCDEVPGLADPGVVPVTVHDSAVLDELSAGSMIDFTWVTGSDSPRLEGVRARRRPAADPQALEAGRLKLLERIATTAAPEPPVGPGRLVPDFSLIDQNREAVTLSRFTGQIVAVSFMYTSCHSPDYCFRLSNNFGLLQKRFASRLGRDIALLTVTFDPVHDQPEVLARYGATWKADGRGWHLLTGPVSEVRRVCRMFGMNAWPDMGMITHDLRTAVIDRKGRLLANLEGNDFSARQLGDLLEAALDRP